MELTGDQKDLTSIDHQQALDLAELAVKIEHYYAMPQDIEWAVAKDGAIYILQCRPLKQMETLKTDLPESLFNATHDAVIVRGGITASPGTASGKVYPVDKGIGCAAVSRTGGAGCPAGTSPVGLLVKPICCRCDGTGRFCRASRQRGQGVWSPCALWGA